MDLSLTLLHPLSEALPICMEMGRSVDVLSVLSDVFTDIPWNATGEVGVLNEGKSLYREKCAQG